MIWLLLTIRPTEEWTPLAIGLSLGLLVVAVLALGWLLSVTTAKYDQEP